MLRLSHLEAGCKVLYALKCNGVRIAASGRGAYSFESGKLVRRLSSAGTLDFTLTPGNRYAQGIGLRSSIVTVERDNAEIFRGFALEKTVSEYGFVRYAAVGDMSALRDVPVGSIDYTGSADQLVTRILNAYNASAERRRRIYKGTVGRTGLGASMTFQSNGWRSAWDLISGLCTDRGGVLRLRYADDGKRVLDWLDHCNHWSTQTAEWGKNLLSLRVTDDTSEMINTIIAEGETEQHESISVVVADEASVAAYGTIAVARRYDAATTEALRAAALADLALGCKVSRVISGQAIDRPTKQEEAFQLGDFVRVISRPHRLDEWSVVSEITDDLTDNKPVQISFGQVSTGLTAPERTAAINRWIVAIQGREPPYVLAIDSEGYYATDLDGYYAIASEEGLD